MKNLNDDTVKTIEHVCRRIREYFKYVLVVPSFDINEDDDASDFVHVNIVNVPEEMIIEVEDVAYDLVREFGRERSRPLCFFLYSLEETARRYPKLAAWQEIGTGRLYLPESSAMYCHRWFTSSLRAIAKDDYELFLSSSTILKWFGVDHVDIPDKLIMPVGQGKNAVAANDELPLAA